MNIVRTKKEIIDSLQRELESLKRENDELRLIISKAHLKSNCTCGINTKGFTTANEWMICPVHGFHVTRSKKGEL